MLKLAEMSKQATKISRFSSQRDEWISRVTDLTHQIAQWSKANGWTVKKQIKNIPEKTVGDFKLPALEFHTKHGDILVTPITFLYANGGRVEVQSCPTLNRVKLCFVDKDNWQIVTDSNVPLRVPWNAETFTQLADDLLA